MLESVTVREIYHVTVLVKVWHSSLSGYNKINEETRQVTKLQAISA